MRMAVLWTYFIGTSSLQTGVAQLMALAKGKLAEDISSKPARGLREIQPHASAGKLELGHLSFVYPSRPNVRILPPDGRVQ
jgi:hypothetical protein